MGEPVYPGSRGGNRLRGTGYQKKMGDKTIGIIGGMGPEATIDVFSKIVAATPSRRDQDHLRIIVDNNPKVPSRYKYIMGEGDNPLPHLIESAKKLEQYGADFLLIPCNAAHHFYDHIQKEVGIPILHIAKETLRYTESMRPKPRRIGLMASGSTVKSGVYQRIFRGSKIELVLPTDQDQQRVSQGIYDFKKGIRSKKIERMLMSIVRSLSRMGAQAIILGCTELPVVLKGVKSTVGLIDANDVLAQAAVKEAKQS